MDNAMNNQVQPHEGQQASDAAERAHRDSYDPHLIPAETAARMEREGDRYKHIPTQADKASAETDDQTDSESIRTTDGYTVDQEGLLNNYAIEPEMYYEVPGDARQAQEEAREERIEELHEVNHDKQGELTMEHDTRGHGPGII